MLKHSTSEKIHCDSRMVKGTYTGLCLFIIYVLCACVLPYSSNDAIVFLFITARLLVVIKTLIQKVTIILPDPT